MAARRSRATRRRVAERAPQPARLLLDTRVWLWWQADDRRLGRRARSAITDASEVYLSVASAWEISIKASLGKLILPKSADIGVELAEDGFIPLAVVLEHTRVLSTLPSHHRDPFDRLLLAQAVAEDLAIVTADPWFGRYNVRVVDAGV